jgi:hypothetical protein
MPSIRSVTARTSVTSDRRCHPHGSWRLPRRAQGPWKAALARRERAGGASPEQGGAVVHHALALGLLDAAHRALGAAARAVVDVRVAKVEARAACGELERGGEGEPLAAAFVTLDRHVPRNEG